MGYQIHTDDDADYFIINVNDLSSGSHAIVDVQCDFCNHISHVEYRQYLRTHQKYEMDCCIQHKTEKQKLTCLKKYGVEYPMQSDVILKKSYETNLERYGEKQYVLSEEGKTKREQTNLKKYGVKSVMSLQSVREKAKQTTLEHYGVENPFSSKEVQKQIAITLSKNNSVKTSSQQLYLSKLYGMELNVPFQSFHLDLVKDNIVVEYDGGGHNLNIKLGCMTEQEFNQKELIREKMIRQAGYRLIRIICPTDRLPADTVLLGLYQDAINYFDETGHTWRNYYVEDGFMRDAEHQNGVAYQYGDLWNAKRLA